jgi:hypothetical protein
MSIKRSTARINPRPAPSAGTGYGDERPISTNDTEEGREKNRRIEATEL